MGLSLMIWMLPATQRRYLDIFLPILIHFGGQVLKGVANLKGDVFVHLVYLTNIFFLILLDGVNKGNSVYLSSLIFTLL